MARAKTGLGRGFSSLIPDDLLDESFDPTASQDHKVSDLRQIKIDQISPDPEQPRRHFDEDSLQLLSQSIVQNGLLQPIVVIPKGDGYMIVAGERRWRAAKLAGLEKMPALVRTLSAQHKLEISLVENLQRRNLNPLETATAYLKLRDQFNLSLEEITQRIGTGAVSTVSNKLRLLKLHKSVQQAIADGVVTEGQARPLIGLDAEMVESVLPLIIKEQWSARKIEQFIVDLKKSGSSDTPQKKATTAPAHAPEAERLTKRFESPVKIRTNSKGAGSITIQFKDNEEFARIEKILAGNS